MSNKRMNIQEIAEYTGMSTYQIDLGCKRGVIPFICFGRRKFFDPEMVDEALTLEAKENQEKARSNMHEQQQQKEVMHYGKLKDMLG